MTEEKNVKENPFEKAEKEVIKQTEEPVAPEQPTPDSEEKEIDVDTISDTRWIKAPKAADIGKTTPLMKVTKFSGKPGRMMTNKDYGERFWSGLTTKDKETLETKKHDEYNVKGIVDGEDSTLKVQSWEMFYKFMALVKHCKKNNLQFKGQTVFVKRMGSGQGNAGKNWELHVPSLKVKIVENECRIVPIE